MVLPVLQGALGVVSSNSAVPISTSEVNSNLPAALGGQLLSSSSLRAGLILGLH